LDGSDELETGACAGSIDGGWVGVPNAAMDSDERYVHRYNISRERHPYKPSMTFVVIPIFSQSIMNSLPLFTKPGPLGKRTISNVPSK
jgi:hypothetical protein